MNAGRARLHDSILALLVSDSDVFASQMQAMRWMQSTAPGQTKKEEKTDMRAFPAFLLGIVVVGGGAYLRDSAYAPPARPYVNWDVVSEAASGFVDSARAQLDRLTKPQPGGEYR